MTFENILEKEENAGKLDFLVLYHFKPRAYHGNQVCHLQMLYFTKPIWKHNGQKRKYW